MSTVFSAGPEAIEVEIGLSDADFRAQLGLLPAIVQTAAAVLVTMPIEYTAACRALENCRTIDEAKLWSTKSDALAAWARIYRNDEAAVAARRLKAHAYRRMSRLAEALAVGTPNRRGQPGAAAVLMGNGISTAETMRIRSVGRIPAEKFESLISQEKPYGIQRFAREGIGLGRNSRLASSENWRIFAGAYSGNANAAQFRVFCRKHDPAELASGIRPDEVEGAVKYLVELREWLSAFERAFPKSDVLP